MAYKIVLDAGHGGTDPGAIYKERKEKDDNLALTLAVGKILEDNGVDVVYTRTEDVYQTPFEKARIANQSGADYFISFHRNSSPEDNQYQGVEVLVYDKSGIKYEMAQNIVGALGELGFREIDNKLYDEKQNEIAEAIAGAILGTLSEETIEAPVYYRVQTGAYRNRENADRMLYQLNDVGYPAFLLYENDLYKVQVGAFQQIGNAINMEQRLRDDGYSTVIVTK